MSNDPKIDPGGRHRLEACDVNAFFNEHVQPGPSRDVIGPGEATFPQYLVTDDNIWAAGGSAMVFEDEYGAFRQFEGLEQHEGEIEEVYLLSGEDRDVEFMRNGIGGLQVAAHEVVVGEILGTSVEPQQYMQQVPREAMRGYSQQYVQTAPRQTVQPQSQPLLSAPGHGRVPVRYIVQAAPPMEMQPSVHCDLRPMAMFEGPSNQALVPQQYAPQQTRPVPVLRSRSKSQPRRPLYGDLEDDSLAYLLQEHDENDWDGVELEDHEYFMGGQQEREAIVKYNDDEMGQTVLSPPKTIQRQAPSPETRPSSSACASPQLQSVERTHQGVNKILSLTNDSRAAYFPPNLSPTQKKEYLLVNYKKACDRYFPFANHAVLEADTRYKPVEAFASDLYRFHSRGAHIHGFFRTVIDVRDRPSPDQTRYIQDIQFGKVFPLFPDYEEWDDKLRDEFRQLTNRLMRIFERKCFYAQSGDGHGKVPVIKRGAKAVPKPPPNYAEEQRVHATGIPKGFQTLRTYTQTMAPGARHLPSHIGSVVQPPASVTRLTAVDNDDLTANEPVAVPRDVGSARVEAYEHNKRVDIKRIVSDAFLNRDRSSHYQEPSSIGSSDTHTYVCRVPPGPSKTLRHQRSLASKAMRMINNRVVEPVIDPASGRYVISLDELRAHEHRAPEEVESRTYVPRPAHTLRQMVDSARKGLSSAAAVSRSERTRLSRIDQAPRLIHNTSSTLPIYQQQNSSPSGRVTVLKNNPPARLSEKSAAESYNSMVTAPESHITRNDHVYLRSRSSGRANTAPPPPPNISRRSASSGRPIASATSRQPPDKSVEGLEEVIVVEDLSNDSSANAQSASGSRKGVQGGVNSQNSRSHSSDVHSASTSTNARQAEKEKQRTVLLRDEHGHLRRVKKMPDGSLLLKQCPPQAAKIGQVRAFAATASEKMKTPNAGGVYELPSMRAKNERRPPRNQFKRSQASVAPWSFTAALVPESRITKEGVKEVGVSSRSTSNPVNARSRGKDAPVSDENDDILVLSDHLGEKKKPQRKRSRAPPLEQNSVGATRSRSRAQKQSSRTCGAPQPSVGNVETRESLVRRRLKQEAEDSDNVVVDVVTEDKELPEKIRELIDALPPPAPPQVAEVQRQPKKAGRPPKKFRGRLARQKQALRDAELAEKVAIKHRELPVLDLALKVIDDPSIELPVKPPIVVDKLTVLDGALLHEVGEVLKEIVAKVSLEELTPKREVKTRSRRRWEHLPERVRSKRQEYKALHLRAEERDITPPPVLIVKPKGRNATRHRQRQQNIDASTSTADLDDTSSKDSSAASQLEQASVNVEIPSENAKFARSPSRTTAQSKHAVTGSTDEQLLPGSCDDGSVNEDDLVDINVDPFFTSAEIDSSASGDENDTPSQKVQRKLQKLFVEPTSSASTSTLKGKHASARGQWAESKKAAKSFPLERSSQTAPHELEDADVTGDEFAELLGDLVATTSHGFILSDSQLLMDADPLAGQPHISTIDLLDTSVDVCDKVESMLDVMEMSLHCSEAASSVKPFMVDEAESSCQKTVMPLPPEKMTVHATAPISSEPVFLEENAIEQSLHHFGGVAPVKISESALEEFALAYSPAEQRYHLPSICMSKQFLSVEEEPVVHETELVSHQSYRTNQNLCHCVTIAITEYEACKLRCAQATHCEVKNSSLLNGVEESLCTTGSIPAYNMLSAQCSCTLLTEEYKLNRHACASEVFTIEPIANNEVVCQGIVDITLNLESLKTNPLENNEVHASIRMPVEDSSSLSDVSGFAIFERSDDVGAASPHIAACARQKSVMLNFIETSCDLQRDNQSETSDILLACKMFDRVCLDRVLPPELAVAVQNDPALSAVGESEYVDVRSEDVNWKLVSHLERIEPRKTGIKPSHSNLSHLEPGNMYTHPETKGRLEVVSACESYSEICGVMDFIVNTIDEDVFKNLSQCNQSVTYTVETMPNDNQATEEVTTVVQEPAEVECLRILLDKLERRSTEDMIDNQELNENIVTAALSAQADDGTFGQLSSADCEVSQIIIVSEESQKLSLSLSVPYVVPRKRSKVRHKMHERSISINRDTSVISETHKISRYLRSEDSQNDGFSELTFLEQCYLKSPDLFGLREDVRKKKRKEKALKLEKEDGRHVNSIDSARLHSKSKPRRYVWSQNDIKLALDRLWRKEDVKPSQGRFYAVTKPPGNQMISLKEDLTGRGMRFAQGFSAADEIVSGSLRGHKKTLTNVSSTDTMVFVRAARPRNHLISDFNLTVVKPSNPFVQFMADIGPLIASTNTTSMLRLSRPRVEGSLENAMEQYDKGVACILEQVNTARILVESVRVTTHWSLHFLMDAQLFMLDILYELWEYTTRRVQLAVFNTYQCVLWEKHHHFFDSRMYCLLFEMNTAAALSSKIETCCSYIRRFEEWNRKKNNYSSIYNHVYGFALSMIKLVTIPNALKRLQALAHWNAKPMDSKSSEELFFVDLVPYFQVGTCPSTAESVDVEDIMCGKHSLIVETLEHLLSYEAAQSNDRVDSFSFLFPSHSVVELCRSQIQKETVSYLERHTDSMTSVNYQELSMLSPMARAYILSQVHESRVKSLMRNNIMNLDKLVKRLNEAYDDLSKNVQRMDMAEFEYPGGQVVFDLSGGKISVSINTHKSSKLEPSPKLKEEAYRLMGAAVENTVFHPKSRKRREVDMGDSRVQKSVELVQKWMMTIPPLDDGISNDDSQSVDTEIEPEVERSLKSPTRVTVIDDEDDEYDGEKISTEVLARNTTKAPHFDNVMTTIAGRRIQYTVDNEKGMLKMRTVDPALHDEGTDDLSATNTFSSASFTSFNQIETLKIVRKPETGELDWLAMIKNALSAAPPPEILPGFLQKGDTLMYQTIDIMKAHEYANHFVRETNVEGEFLDLRKEQREKFRQFQRIDYFERKRNARFEAISSEKSLEMPRPGPNERDKVPLYALWLREVLQYADIERKRLIQLKPINHVGRCRAARSEMIREFAIPIKRKKRSASTPPWLGRTIYEHFGEYLSLGMARLEFELSGRNQRVDGQFSIHDDNITSYFVSRNNSPSTMVDPLELLENPYSYFRPTSLSRKRPPSPLLESSLMKRVHFLDPPIFAPLTSVADEPDSLYPPCCFDYDTSDEDE